MREGERERESCYNILFVFSLEWILNRIVVNAILVCVCVFFFCVHCISFIALYVVKNCSFTDVQSIHMCQRFCSLFCF